MINPALSVTLTDGLYTFFPFLMSTWYLKPCRSLSTIMIFFIIPLGLEQNSRNCSELGVTSDSFSETKTIIVFWFNLYWRLTPGSLSQHVSIGPGNVSGRSVASLNKEVNPWLANRPLIFNGRLVTRGLTSLVREATEDRPTPGARFTKGFSIAIQIRLKFRFTITSILIQWSLQNFVHGTTALLSWHVQKCVAIWWPATEL